MLAGGLSFRSRAICARPLRNGHSAKASRDGSGIRTLTLTAVTNGDFSAAKYQSHDGGPVRVRGLWLKPGDLFIERANTPELVGTEPYSGGPRNWAIFPDLLIRVRVSEEVLPEFLEHVLLAEPTRRYFRGAAQGIAGSMPKIDQGTVERLLVPLPPLDEQRTVVAKIEQAVSRVEAMSSGIDGALRRSAALRRSLLECAFSGRLVPQDPADEPASELIRGIAALRAQAPQVSRRRSTVPA